MGNKLRARISDDSKFKQTMVWPRGMCDWAADDLLVDIRNFNSVASDKKVMYCSLLN